MILMNWGGKKENTKYILYFVYVVSSSAHAQEAIIFLAIRFLQPLFQVYRHKKRSLICLQIIYCNIFSVPDKTNQHTPLSGTYQLNENFYDHFLFQESKRS